MPQMPPFDEMLMIDPPPARCIDGTTDFMPRKVPMRFTSMTRRNLLDVLLLDRREVEDAGVVDQDVTGPKRASASATAATHSSSDVTSRWR